MKAALVLVLGIAGCGEPSEPVAFPKPADATEAQRFPRGEGHQDSFVLMRQYPAADVIDHYSKVFTSWTPCYWNQRGWDGHPDVSGNSPKYVHRIARFWVRGDNKAMATVYASYESAYAMCRDAPDNDKQVVIVLYDVLGDAKALASQLGAKCDATPNTTPHADARASATTCKGPRAGADGRER